MPNVLTHPRAPTPQAAPAVTPKYLVRNDGMVTVYTPVLAKLPNFTPVETLPAAHVLASELAAQRDALTREAREAHQARMEAAEAALRDRMEAAVTQVGGVSVVTGPTATLAPGTGPAAVAEPAVASAEPAVASAERAVAAGASGAIARGQPAAVAPEAKVQASAVTQPQAPGVLRAQAPVQARAAAAVVAAPVTAQEIGAADKAGLKEFFAQQGVKADLRRPVEELRALAHEVARKGRAGSA